VTHSHWEHPALHATRPLVIAHRGGALLRPENTLPAFDHAASLGADGFELDVHLSRDGVPVVIHDSTLERTTGGAGRVADLTADELARIDVGDGAGVPRLVDVLTRYATERVIIELKGSRPELATRVVDEIRRAGAANRVLLGGFSRRALAAARARGPELATGAAREEIRLAVYGTWVRLPIRSTGYRCFQVPEGRGWQRVVTPRFVRAAHAAGLPVYVWTVNDPADMRRLLDWGVDGLITDRPDVALEVVRAR
jgi:glycerophosphoryl diester phosphodiesterase